MLVRLPRSSPWTSQNTFHIVVSKQPCMHTLLTNKSFSNFWKSLSILSLQYLPTLLWKGATNLCEGICLAQPSSDHPTHECTEYCIYSIFLYIRQRATFKFFYLSAHLNIFNFGCGVSQAITWKRCLHKLNTSPVSAPLYLHSLVVQ